MTICVGVAACAGKLIYHIAVKPDEVCVYKTSPLQRHPKKSLHILKFYENVKELINGEKVFFNYLSPDSTKNAKITCISALYHNETFIRTGMAFMSWIKNTFRKIRINSKDHIAAEIRFAIIITYDIILFLDFKSTKYNISIFLNNDDSLLTFLKFVLEHNKSFLAEKYNTTLDII